MRLSFLAVFLPLQLNPQASTGVVIVRLTDSITQQPIADAAISISSMTFPRPRFFRGKTDQLGLARIEAVEPGGYDVFIKRIGYADSNYMGAQRIHVSVSPGGEVVVKAALEPTAGIEGRVVGEDNEPLAGVIVHAQRDGGLPVIGEADKDGRFKIDNLAPGPTRFRLLFRPSGFRLPCGWIRRQPSAGVIRAVSTILALRPPRRLASLCFRRV